MEQDRFQMAEYKAELDSALTGVMPRTWLGFGRLRIHNSDLSDSQRNRALRATEKLAKKHPSKDTEALAEVVIEKICE